MFKWSPMVAIFVFNPILVTHSDELGNKVVCLLIFLLPFFGNNLKLRSCLD
ncbi:hypothetical protein SHDE107825_07680 [Shewanella denitrificans]|jgi:hypothetical protein